MPAWVIASFFSCLSNQPTEFRNS